MGNLTIGAFARACGVGVETVRYYQRLKLLDVRRGKVACPIIESLVRGR